MKIRMTLMTILVSFLLTLNVAEAGPNFDRDQHSDRHQRHHGHHTKAPEISVASGASALAFLSGVLLLVGEKTRKRKI